jgi:hypothetical protein
LKKQHLWHDLFPMHCRVSRNDDTIAIAWSRRALSRFLLATVGLLAVTQRAAADVIAPTAFFFPGVLPLTLWMALPASVLAAVLERPFVSRAGVANHALWYSMQANFVSLVLGYVTLPVAAEAIFAIGPLWSVFVITLSVLSEGLYYQWRVTPLGQALKWRWIVWSNIFSSFVILLIPFAALAIKSAQPDATWKLAPYQDVLMWGSIVGSVLAFVAGFLVPRIGRRKETGVLVTPGGQIPTNDHCITTAHTASNRRISCRKYCLAGFLLGSARQYWAGLCDTEGEGGPSHAKA